MDKVFDDDYQFPGLAGQAIAVTAEGMRTAPFQGKPVTCRLRVYREHPWKGVVAVATEISTNPGASITNAIEGLCARVWADFIPGSGHPPVLFDHYETASYDPPGRTGDEFSLVTFSQVRADKLVVASPSWQWWPGSMVRRLTGDPELGDGFDRKLDRLEPGDDWTEVAG